MCARWLFGLPMLFVWWCKTILLLLSFFYISISFACSLSLFLWPNNYFLFQTKICWHFYEIILCVCARVCSCRNCKTLCKPNDFSLSFFFFAFHFISFRWYYTMKIFSVTYLKSPHTNHFESQNQTVSKQKDGKWGGGESENGRLTGKK